jgi:hypothetical protein
MAMTAMSTPDMKGTARFIFWTLVFMVLLLGLDQFFHRIPASTPIHVEIRTFYLDLRGRLLRLADADKAPTTKPVLPPKSPLQAPPPKGQATNPGAADAAPRYLYVDAAGQLHFADRLEDIPPAFRRDAQTLAR